MSRPITCAVHLALTLLVLERLIALGFLDGRSLEWLAATAAAAPFQAALAARFSGGKPWSRRGALLLALHLLLPGFGGVLCCAVMATQLFSRRMDLLGGFHEEDRDLARGVQEASRRQQGDVTRRLNVEPLVEIIRGRAGTDLKRGAIETLQNLMSPQAVKLLRECLQDHDSEVRFFASSALSRIEERLNAALRGARGKLAEKPDGEGFLRLGKTYFEFVYLEFYDRAGLSYYLDEAIRCFEQAVAADAGNTEALRALEKAYLAAGKSDAAQSIHETAAAASQPGTGQLLYLAENHFNRRRFRECREVVALSRHQLSAFRAVKDVQDIWALAQPRKNAP